MPARNTRVTRLVRIAAHSQTDVFEHGVPGVAPLTKHAPGARADEKQAERVAHAARASGVEISTEPST